MIGISRGEEPTELKEARYVQLARAELARRAQEPIPFAEYDVAKDVLWERQHTKCAFCEMNCATAGQPVEHFRPKGKAIRENGKSDDGYWWLAWSWENLLFACVTCNSAHKRDHFPLRKDRHALKELQAPPGKEKPLLVDPAAEDPMEYIQFFEVRENKWRPLPRNGSDRGLRTIEITGIDSTAHQTLYQNFVTREPLPSLLSEVQLAIDGGNAQTVQSRWQKLQRTLFHPTAPYHALAYWVVDRTFPEPVRRQWQLPLPRLGVPTPTPPSVDLSNPLLEGLPRELALRCRAVGTSGGSANLRELLRDLCAHAPQELDDLAAMLRRKPASLGRHLKALEKAGTLARDPQGRYRTV